MDRPQCIAICSKFKMATLLLTFYVRVISKAGAIIGVRGGGGGQGGQLPPPSLVRNINHSGNFYLKVGQSSCSCFCFINILNTFFSFVTCSMHNNPHQNAGNGNKGTLFFKIFLRSIPPRPLGGSRTFGAIRANSCPPPSPKFLGPYAYGCDKTLASSLSGAWPGGEQGKAVAPSR